MITSFICPYINIATNHVKLFPASFLQEDCWDIISAVVISADDELLAAYSFFVTELDAIWQHVVSRFGLPSVRRPIWTFEQGRVSFNVTDDPIRIDAAIHRRAEKTLQKSEPCRGFAAEVKASLAQRKLVPQRGARRLDDYELLYYLVSRAYPLRAGEIIRRRSESEKRASLSGIMADLSADTYSVQLIAPLLNFTSFSSPADVTSGVSIHPFCNEEKNKLVDTFAQYRPFPDPGFDVGELARSGWALRLSRSLERDQEIPYEDLLWEATRALSCLRLLKPGRVGALAAIVLSEASGNSIHDPPDVVVSAGGSQFELKEEEAGSLRAIGRALDLPEARPLDYALRWYNQAVGAHWCEGMLTATAIALEAALLPNVREELSFRLALRGAALTATEHDPQEVFRILRALYTTRSTIVHTGRSLSGLSKTDRRRIANLDGSPTPQALPSIALATARRVLRSLVSKLDHGVDFSQILESLEEDAVAGLGVSRFEE